MTQPLTLDEIFAAIADERVDVKLWKDADEKPERRYAAAVGSKDFVYAADPVTAVLRAMGQSLIAGRAAVGELQKEIDTWRATELAIVTKVPAAEAFVASKIEPCDDCGEVHDKKRKARASMSEAVVRLLSEAGVPTAVVEVEKREKRADVEAPKKKDGEN